MISYSLNPEQFVNKQPNISGTDIILYVCVDPLFPDSRLSGTASASFFLWISWCWSAPSIPIFVMCIFGGCCRIQLQWSELLFVVQSLGFYSGQRALLVQYYHTMCWYLLHHEVRCILRFVGIFGLVVFLYVFWYFDELIVCCIFTDFYYRVILEAPDLVVQIQHVRCHLFGCHC